MSNLLKFLKFLAILFILLVLLVFIYFSTFKQHFKNEVKYQEQFVDVTPTGDLIRKGIKVEIPKGLLDASQGEAIKQKQQADSMLSQANKNVSNWKNFKRNRKATRSSKEKEIDNVVSGINTYASNLSHITSDIQKVRSGDPDATDMTQYGTYDATLFL
jgi:hypothetical protein